MDWTSGSLAAFVASPSALRHYGSLGLSGHSDKTITWGHQVKALLIIRQSEQQVDIENANFFVILVISCVHSTKQNLLTQKVVG